MNTNTQVQYRVGPKGGVCIGPNSTYFGPNVVIPHGIMDEKAAARLLKERAIVRVGEVAAPVQEPKLPPVGVSDRAFAADQREAGGAEIPEQVSGGSAAAQARAALAQIEADRAAGNVKAVEPVTSVEMVRADEPKASAAPAATSGFTHDPDGLLGMSADDLRKLVLDIDPTMEVNHLDEVELIAVLSSEFVAPTQA